MSARTGRAGMYGDARVAVGIRVLLLLLLADFWLTVRESRPAVSA